MRFLEGSKTYLRPYKATDLPILTEWLNDPEVTHFMFYGQLPRTEEQVKTFIEGDLANPNHAIFVVCLRKNDASVGFCGLYDWHRTARKAEMRILIGEKSAWGKGIGTEVVELITWYGFDRLNLHRIYLGFTAANSAAKTVYSSAGYVEEGILRDDIFRNNRYYDSVRMAILRPDYEKRLKAVHDKRFGRKSPRFLSVRKEVTK